MGLHPPVSLLRLDIGAPELVTLLPPFSWDRLPLRENTWSCSSFFAKEPLIMRLFCGKWPTKIRHSMGLHHPLVEIECCFEKIAFGIECDCVLDLSSKFKGEGICLGFRCERIMCCITLQRTASPWDLQVRSDSIDCRFVEIMRCNIPQHAATLCNTMQRRDVDMWD